MVVRLTFRREKSMWLGVEFWINDLNGTRYCNTDYALAGAVKQAKLIRFIVVTYDIACQYSIKIKERFAKNFPDLSSIIDRISFLVPKLHLQGHKDDCQFRWSLNFTRWMGCTDGEHIEAVWSKSKQAGGMTKEMNNGHRHDTLTAFHNDWNWVKAQNLGVCIQIFIPSILIIFLQLRRSKNTWLVPNLRLQKKWISILGLVSSMDLSALSDGDKFQQSQNW